MQELYSGTKIDNPNAALATKTTKKIRRAFGGAWQERFQERLRKKREKQAVTIEALLLAFQVHTVSCSGLA
jgi:hypothetical protein